MTTYGILQITLYLVVLIALVKPLGLYMARVLEGRRTFLDPLVRPIERVIYRLSGIQPDEEMDWKKYTIAMLVFNMFGLAAVYIVQRTQAFLPLNPAGMSAVSPDGAYNTAVSFATNTNWQDYGGETTLSYLTQMIALTVQNFASAATGMAMLAAVIRGFVRHNVQTIGNFWADLTRTTLYILMPLSIVLSLLLVSQGVVQTFDSRVTAKVLQPSAYDNPKLDTGGNPIIDAKGNPVAENATLTQQTIAVGPAASQIAIKQLGTNGGGFFNVNSAHPFENPTPLSDFLEMLSILLIPAALCYTFGVMVGDTRQGWAILAAMTIIFAAFVAIGFWAESSANPALTKLGVDQVASETQAGGNMEGKELRFGIANSALWMTATTSASNGSVNSMHDSFMPLGGMVALISMHFGEVIYGGVGSGLYGMLALVIVAVFVAGLMVGRTPEYLGKKIESYEMKMASLAILIMPLLVLFLTALALVTDAGKATILNPGAHGFSEVLYAFTSMGNNNGSAFAGIGVNTLFYNLWGGIAMLVARYWLAIPMLAVAGSLARKKTVPASSGTLQTYSPLFVSWLIAVVIIVATLNFIPALALGPVVEHLMLGG
jgi:potassium-transporting ATPase potassium-binding subunit